MPHDACFISSVLRLDARGRQRKNCDVRLSAIRVLEKHPDSSSAHNEAAILHQIIQERVCKSKAYFSDLSSSSRVADQGLVRQSLLHRPAGVHSTAGVILASHPWDSDGFPTRPSLASL